MPLLNRTPLLILPAGLLFALVSSSAAALEGSWQAGVNAGLSIVSPDTDGSGFSLEDDQSTAFSAYFALDVTPVISAEIAFTDLGEATLSQDETISYQAISIGATAYVWGEKAAEDRSEGASGYLRLGFSSIDNESNIELNESNNTALWLGAGVQYPLAQNWGLRAEVASYDGDVQAIIAGVFWHTGGQSRRGATNTGAVGRSVSAPVPVAPAPQVSTDANVVTNPVPQRKVEPTPTPTPTEPSVATGQSCPPAAAAKISDPVHCSRVNGVVVGLEFIGNTAEIDPSSNAVLDQIAFSVLMFPGTGMEIRAYTQSSGNAQQDATLSAQRARSVARYLVQEGVPVGQLRAKAFGATQSLGDDQTAAGRRINNRIELSSF